MTDVRRISCKSCEKTAQDNELLLQQLYTAQQEAETFRVRYETVLVESRELARRIDRLKISETAHYHALSKATKMLRLMKDANNVELELEAKRIEMKKYDVEEKKIDLELMRMRDK